MPDTTFARGSEDNSKEELEAFRCSETLSSTRFSVNYSDHSGRSRNESLRTLSMPLVLSLLVDAGCCEGITASCDNVVGGAGVAELEEPVNKPGTIDRYVVCSVALSSSAIFDEFVVSDHWSNGRNIRDLRRVFPSERTASVFSRSITLHE